MERFDDNGHITAQGFSLLLHGEPDTLSRLELAEHLSFCDECCQKYADLMETEPLFFTAAARSAKCLRAASQPQAYHTL